VVGFNVVGDGKIAVSKNVEIPVGWLHGRKRDGRNLRWQIFECKDNRVGLAGYGTLVGERLRGGGTRQAAQDEYKWKELLHSVMGCESVIMNYGIRNLGLRLGKK
jgi:hypothetical protein